jgi:hypothetical protein
MVSTNEAQGSVLEMIKEASESPVSGVSTSDEFNNRERRARAVLALAEAYAWLARPGQSHGGGVVADK